MSSATLEKTAEKSKEQKIVATVFSRGIALGQLLHFEPHNHVCDDRPLEESLRAKEIKKWQRALARAKREITRLQAKMQKEGASEGAAIFESHLQIMKDPELLNCVEDQIKEEGYRAPYALQLLLEDWREHFLGLADPIFRERFYDLQDIVQRIWRYLEMSAPLSWPDKAVLYMEELSLATFAEAPISKIQGLITKEGGYNSHLAIMARSRNIPYLCEVDMKELKVESESEVIVDGYEGLLIVNPDEETKANCEKRRLRYESRWKKFLGKKVPAQTKDGQSLSVLANIEDPAEVSLVRNYQGEGIGLLRTEAQALIAKRYPNEDEQFQFYYEIASELRRFKPDAPMVIRLFDIGNDKTLEMSNESNPALGCRAIRFLLKEQELLKIQMRAILRTNEKTPLSVLVPMVTEISEILTVKKIMREVAKELNIKELPKVGAMIEVPAAALIVDQLSTCCEFFSIGTNDLIQYTLAVDRAHPGMIGLYKASNPSFLRLLSICVSACLKSKKPFSVCGEMASEPHYLPLLVGLGVRQFSVSPIKLPEVKMALSQFTLNEAKELAKRALKQTHCTEVEELINHYRTLKI